jgi:hypothetical protein
MAQKKRGGNPIRITLTEDQISDIIQSAAKTRRGLKVESLEDRIAPSLIGGPMLDPSLVGGDEPPPLPEPLPELPGGTPGDLPLVEGPAPLPEGLPGLPGEPVLPGGTPGDLPLVEGPAPLPFPLPGDGGPVLPGDGGVGEIDPYPTNPSAPGSFRFHHAGQEGAPEFPGGADAPADEGPINPQDYQHANNVIQHQVSNTVANGGPMPTAEEIEEHRRNILRQLRGN